MTRIRIGLLSFAHGHAQIWATALRKSERAELVGIWDDNAERGRKAAADNETAFHASLAELLGRRDLDAVGICSEPSRHAELTIEAARAGKHVLCEKPMSTTLRDCDAMTKACADAGVRYMQSFPKRFDPVNFRIRELLQQGAIGTVSTVRHRHSVGLASLYWKPGDATNWFVRPELSGGGTDMDVGVHATDWLHWMFGRPESVVAEVRRMRDWYGVEDNAAAIYSFTKGVLGIHQVSWTEVAAVSTVEIFGDRGTIIQRYADMPSVRNQAKLDAPLMVYREDHQRWEAEDLPIHFPRQQEVVMEMFVQSLADGVAPPVSASDGRIAVEMVLGAYRAAREGRRVTFPLAADA